MYAFEKDLWKMTKRIKAFEEYRFKIEKMIYNRTIEVEDRDLIVEKTINAYSRQL
jgi:hypothetical protein